MNFYNLGSRHFIHGVNLAEDFIANTTLHGRIEKNDLENYLVFPFKEYQGIIEDIKKCKTLLEMGEVNSVLADVLKKYKIVDLKKYQKKISHLLGEKESKVRKPGTDNDCIYIVEVIDLKHNKKKVHKIGITSLRLDDQRIKYLSKRNKMDLKIVCLVKTKTQASSVETILLEIGENPEYKNIDGASEFRAFNRIELSKVKNIVQEYASDVIFFHEK